MVILGKERSRNTAKNEVKKLLTNLRLCDIMMYIRRKTAVSDTQLRRDWQARRLRIALRE